MGSFAKERTGSPSNGQTVSRTPLLFFRPSVSFTFVSLSKSTYNQAADKRPKGNTHKIDVNSISSVRTHTSFHAKAIATGCFHYRRIVRSVFQSFIHIQRYRLVNSDINVRSFTR